MSVGEKIRELRIEKDLLQRELAAIIHIAANTLSQFESGKANPSYDVLISIADFFEVSTDYLLGREDDFGVINIPVKEKTADVLSTEERELLNIFKNLSSNHALQVLEYARYFASREDAIRSRK